MLSRVDYLPCRSNGTALLSNLAAVLCARTIKVFGEYAYAVAAVIVGAVFRTSPFFRELARAISASLHTIFRTRIRHLFVRTDTVSAISAAVLPAIVYSFEPVTDTVSAISTSATVRWATIFVFARAAEPVSASTLTAILGTIFRVLVRATESVAAADFGAVLGTS